jgi:hypothetical protein
MADIAVLPRAQRGRDAIAARIPVDSVRGRVLAARVDVLLPTWGAPKPEASTDALPLALEALPKLEPTPYGQPAAHVQQPCRASAWWGSARGGRRSTCTACAAEPTPCRAASTCRVSWRAK